MTAEEIARTLARAFREAGANYPAEPDLILGGAYPLVIIWDDVREVSAVIACTSNRHNYRAKRYAEACAETLDLALNEAEISSGAVAYFAHPAATDPTAIMIEEFIWNGGCEDARD